MKFLSSIFEHWSNFERRNTLNEGESWMKSYDSFRHRQTLKLPRSGEHFSSVTQTHIRNDLKKTTEVTDIKLTPYES